LLGGENTRGGPAQTRAGDNTLILRKFVGLKKGKMPLSRKKPLRKKEEEIVPFEKGKREANVSASSRH